MDQLPAPPPKNGVISRIRRDWVLILLVSLAAAVALGLAFFDLEERISNLIS
jgi:hypothetical protein